MQKHYGLSPKAVAHTAIVFDCGGSKTLAALYANDIRIAECRGPAANPNFREPQTIIRELCAQASSLLLAHGYKDNDLAIITGVSMLRKKDYPCLQIFRQHFPKANISLLGEKPVNHYAALGGAPGFVIHCGTGSYVHFSDNGRDMIIGGHGSYVSDEGSGYYIGLNVLKRVFRAIEGRAPATLMTGMLFDNWNIYVDSPLKIADLAREVWSPTPECKKRICELTYIAADASRKDDTAAYEILQDAAEQLAEQLSVLVSKCSTPATGRYGFSGGMFNLSIFSDYTRAAIARRYPALVWQERCYDIIDAVWRYYCSCINS